jgi:ribosomal protein S18 acetylase RimI-like enzyme
MRAMPPQSSSLLELPNQAGRWPNGVRFRLFRSADDCAAMAAVREQSRARDRVDRLSSLEGVPTADEVERSLRTNQCEPAQDVLIVEAVTATIGYCRVDWWTEVDGTRLYRHDGHLVPAWRGQGIGSAMLGWSQRRLREIAQNHPRDGKGILGANASTTERDKTRLLIDDGYRKAFALCEMEFRAFDSLRARALPDGFTCRVAVPGDLRLIWEANNEVYAGRDYVAAPTEAEYQEFVASAGDHLSLWFVAWDGDRIAAFVLGELRDGRGEIVEVSTRAPYRRRGLATALLTTSLLALQARGATLVRLHTSSDNVAGARTLYERLGFSPRKEYVRYRKPLAEIGHPPHAAGGAAAVPGPAPPR